MKYVLLPGKNPGQELKQYHEVAFNFWHDAWSDFFKKFHPDFKVRADDFFRQDYVGMLTDEKMTPLAIHLYSIFEVDSAHQLKQSYLNDNFTASYFEKINQLNLKNVITFESMMVNPAFRKSGIGHSIAPMLYAGGIHLVKALNKVDAMIAPARNDVGVTRLACSGGAEVIEQHELHGFPVSLIIGRKEKLHLGFLDELSQKRASMMFNTESNRALIADKEQYENSKRIAG